MFRVFACEREGTLNSENANGTHPVFGRGLDRVHGRRRGMEMPTPGRVEWSGEKESERTGKQKTAPSTLRYGRTNVLGGRHTIKAPRLLEASDGPAQRGRKTTSQSQSPRTFHVLQNESKVEAETPFLYSTRTREPRTDSPHTSLPP